MNAFERLNRSLVRDRNLSEEVQYQVNPPVGETVTVRGVWTEGAAVYDKQRGIFATLFILESAVVAAKGDLVTRAGRQYRVANDPTSPEFRDGHGGITLELRALREGI